MNKLSKDWKTISLTTLLALGGASLLGNHHAVHADITSPNQTQHVANTKATQSINPSTKIQIKPEVLHSLASNDNNKPSQQSAQSSTSFSYVAKSTQSNQAQSGLKSTSSKTNASSQVSNQSNQNQRNIPILDVLGQGNTAHKSASASVAPKSVSNTPSSTSTVAKSNAQSRAKFVSPKSSANINVQPTKVLTQSTPKVNDSSIQSKIAKLKAEIQQEKSGNAVLEQDINRDNQTIQSDENADSTDSSGNVYFWNQSPSSSSTQSTKATKATKANGTQQTNVKPTRRTHLRRQIKRNNKKLNNANQSISRFANKIHHQQRAVKYHNNPKNKATARIHRRFTKRAQVNYHKLANAYDISSYQGYINNNQARKLKREVNFMVLKAQGGDIEDPQINHNEYEMARNKIPYGAYSYSYYSSPANARIEARELVQRAPKAKFYVNDCEGNYTYGSLNASTQAWAYEMHHLTKKPVILYSGAYFMSSQLTNRTRKAYDGLWLADYGYEPNTPYHYDLWQDYDNFYSPALGKRIDADVFPNGYNKPLRFWTNGRK